MAVNQGRRVRGPRKARTSRVMSCGCYVLRGQIIFPVNPGNPHDGRYMCVGCALADRDPCGCTRMGEVA